MSSGPVTSDPTLHDAPSVNGRPTGACAPEHRGVSAGLTGQTMTLAKALAQPGAEDIEFDPPRLQDVAKPADLS